MDYLENAKNQIFFDFYKPQEKGLQIAQSLARYMFLNEETEEQVNYLEQIEHIKSIDLRKIADSYLSKGKYVIVSIVPKN